MSGKRKSVFNIAAEVSAEIFQAQAVLQGVETYVEYHFQDGQYGELQSLIDRNAGNVQVLLSVMSRMLGKAESAVEELDTILHDMKEKGVFA